MTRPAWDALPAWSVARRRAGRIVLLLDFDGTLAPIVDRPEDATLPPETRRALERLRRAPDVAMALVSGRGLADVRERAALPEVAYAGNHGMEIEGPGVREVHAEAAAARPELDRVVDALRPALAEIPGAILEDKGLTLSIHHRMVAPGAEAEVERRVERATADRPRLRVTRGKRVLEVRPRVDWHKGRAVEFLLDRLAPPPGTPVLYLGDDTTDEDAFRAVASRPGGAGVRVGEDAGATAAAWSLRDPADVGRLLSALADASPDDPATPACVR